MEERSAASAADIHRRATVVDCHNDLLLTVASERRTEDKNLFGTYWIPQLRAGGIDVQVTPVYIESEYEPEGALRRMLVLIECLHEAIQANEGEAALCTSGEEIDRCLHEGKIAFILALEGCDAIAPDVELLRSVSRLGVRMASLTHFGRNMFADGSAEDSTESRLTRAGVAAVGEMERLGLIVDVSHLSTRGVDHVLEIATRPVIASHSSARAVQDHHRNLSDEHLEAIGKTGGVVGVNAYPGFIDATRPTIDRVVDHIDRVAEVAGIEHVGLGPDFIQEYTRHRFGSDPDLRIEGLPVHWSITGLERSEHLPHLTECMVSRGWTETDVRLVLGENFLRVFREVMGRSTDPS